MQELPDIRHDLACYEKNFIDGNVNRENGFQNNKTVELAKTRMAM